MFMRSLGPLKQEACGVPQPMAAFKTKAGKNQNSSKVIGCSSLLKLCISSWTSEVRKVSAPGTALAVLCQHCSELPQVPN